MPGEILQQLLHAIKQKHWSLVRQQVSWLAQAYGKRELTYWLAQAYWLSLFLRERLVVFYCRACIYLVEVKLGFIIAIRGGM